MSENCEFCRFFKYILIAIFGVILIYSSVGLSTAIPHNDYILELEMQSNDGEPPRFNEFLWKHDFTDKKGNITFRPSGNKVEKIIIDFPTFIDSSSVFVNFHDCEGECAFNLADHNLELKEQPVNKPYHHVLVIEPLPLRFTSLSVEYKANLIPNGRFQIYNNNNNLTSKDESVEFKLGRDYILDGCSRVERGVLGCEPFDRDTVKVTFKENEQHIFGILSQDQNKSIFKHILDGLGIALIAAGLIELFRKRK